MTGASTYNYWKKEKPATTNQVYGFLQRNALDSTGRTKSAILRPAVPLEARQTIARTESAKYTAEKPRLTRKVNYYIAPPLPETYQPSKNPDSGKAIYLWNALTGCTVRVKM